MRQFDVCSYVGLGAEGPLGRAARTKKKKTTTDISQHINTLTKLKLYKTHYSHITLNIICYTMHKLTKLK